MIEHEFKATFEQPPEQVFDFLIDFRNEPKWNPDCQSVEKTSPGPIGQGTKFSSKVKRVGRVESEIVSFQRPTHCSTRDKARGMEGGFDFDLQPKNGGTELSARVKMQPRGPMKLLEPVMGPMMKRMLNELPGRMQRGIAAR